MPIPTGWSDTVSINGLTLTWDERQDWYDGGDGDGFVQAAYGGPVWVAELNPPDPDGRLQQQYFTPNPDGTVTWLAPVICFYPWGAPGGMPTGGFYLQGSSGLSFGWKSGRFYPTDIPFAPDGPLTSYIYGFVPPTPPPKSPFTASRGFAPQFGFDPQFGFTEEFGFTKSQGF